MGIVRMGFVFRRRRSGVGRSRLAVAGALAALVVVSPGAIAATSGDYSGTDHSFGSQTVATSSAAFTVTITNNSATNHTIHSLSLSGSDPGQFSLTNNTCPGALNAGSQCTVDVTFTPTTIGAKSAQIDVVDEAGTTSGVALLDGTGSASRRYRSLHRASTSAVNSSALPWLRPT
jgi:Abnormal spindle-like microcephaly-assoc'd, ASPM-SPD-2-Hydin